jgi:hypothetical protein
VVILTQRHTGLCTHRESQVGRLTESHAQSRQKKVRQTYPLPYPRDQAHTNPTKAAGENVQAHTHTPHTHPYEQEKYPN